VKDVTGRIVTIGGTRVGAGHPVFVIAEVGYNFNTLDEALASVDAAAASGADAVKFQTFRAETLTSRLTEFPAEAGATNQFEEFKRYELSEEWHRALFARARQRGILAFSTPGHRDDVDLLERLGVPAYKIGSDDLTNLPFLSYVGATGKPIIFSTGMGTLAEVEEAVAAIRGAGNEDIVILQCTSNYPIRDPRVVNLRVIETFRQAFGVPAGFSDHTTSFAAALGAVALGAAVIERHFTIDKHLEVPDAFFSSDPAEMTALVAAIRELEASLSHGVKRPTATEVAMRRETRKSLVARNDIARGQPLTADHVIIKRPGYGIAPKLQHLALGRRARADIRADEVITWEMLE
jgi:N,N'-diacetyllegionaminate synthase